jgi:hypothetical protein
MKFQSFIANGFLILMLGLISLSGSYFLSYFLEITDGAIYLRAYNLISDLDLIDGYEKFFINTGGAEPISFLFFYTFSKFVSIESFNWFLNTVLLFVTFKFLYNQRIKVLIFLPLLITNFYILLLEYGVLRLKIALIFWILSLNTLNKKKSNLFYFLSFLSHFQMALILVIKLLVDIVVKRNIKIKFSFIFFLVILTFLYEKILNKFLLYSSELHFPFKIVLFFIPMFFVINRIKNLSITFIVFFFVGVIIGEERLIILLFFLLLSEYLLFAKRDLIRGVLLVFYCLYFSVKGIFFAQSLVNGVSYF